MINIPSFKGKDFPPSVEGLSWSSSSYEFLLSELLSIDGFTQHRLLDSAGGHPVYGFSIGNLESKPTILIDGSIHKVHEWTCGYWIMHFMEVLARPHEYPEMAQLINEFKAKYSFYFIPVTSPDNFVTSYNQVYIQGNTNGVDVAENFDYRFEETGEGAYPFSENESKNIRDVILTTNPVLYINCHGYGSSYGSVIREPLSGKYSLFYRDLAKSLQISADMESESKIGPVNPVSSSYNWATNQLSNRGVGIISNVLEVGVLEKTKVQSQIGVTALLLHCIYADNYLTTNNLTLH